MPVNWINSVLDPKTEARLDGELNARSVQRISQNWSADKVHELLQSESELERQPPSAQSDCKVSYYLHNANKKRLNRLKFMLFDHGVHASLIYRSQRDLDVLPSGVNKGTAAAFVAKQLGFDVNHVIVESRDRGGQLRQRFQNVRTLFSQHHRW